MFLVEHCGVVHIHENRQFVGGSKAEDHMSKCAIQDVYELHQNSQIPAVYCEPLSEVTIYYRYKVLIYNIVYGPIIIPSPAKLRRDIVTLPSVHL
jgi:hypothetical protein